MLRQRLLVSATSWFRWQGARIASEAGNAVIEFVVVGIGLQLALLAFVTSLAASTDSQSAADLMARQALRAMQLGASPNELSTQLEQLAITLSLSPADYDLTVTGDCSATVSVAARVRTARAQVDAPCN